MAQRDAAAGDLLLALYAIEDGSVDPSHLARMARDWARRPETPFAEVLAGAGRLDAGTVERLQRRVRRELDASPGDRPDRSATADPDATTDHPAPADAGPGENPGEGDPAGAGRFRVLRSQARGGLGEVFLAHDAELNRPVALKELRAHDPAGRARFLFEAEVTGGLEHPGIVPVYSLGRHADGRPFYAMRQLGGGTLREAIGRFHPAGRPAGGAEAQSPGMRRLLRSVIEACNAVAYAHSRGVVHRDLKPENVMLGDYGETLVVDWGLAKRIDARGAPGPTPPAGPGPGADPSLTEPGMLVGTPRYMSPEQAEGDQDRVGPASDIYSLGAILYCVLVGHDAFTGGDAASVLGRVRRGVFPAPRSLRRSIDPTLEATCLRAMSLDPRARHATALELADDLEGWFSEARYRVEHEAALAELGASRARLALEHARRCFDRDARDEGMLWLSRALEDAPAGPPALRGAIQLSLGAWHAGEGLLERRYDHGGAVHAVALCPEGRRLATAGADRAAQLWDLATGSPLSPPLGHDAPVRAVAFHPADARLASAGDDGMIRFWDANTGEAIDGPIRAGFPVTALAFSPDGSRLAAAGGPGETFLWDAATGGPVRGAAGTRGAILTIAFARDGSALAVAGAGGDVLLIDPATGSALGPPLAHDAAVEGLAFDAAGGRLLAGDREGRARLWDVARRVAVAAPAGRGAAQGLALRPDGGAFAAIDEDGAARLRDATSGRPIGGRLDHGTPVACLAFRPDGAVVATGGRDGTVRLWCAATAVPIGPPLAHGGALRGLTFGGDGRRLISRGHDATVRCWAIPPPLGADAERISYWIRARTGLEFDEGDAVRPMDVPTGWDLRRRLDDLGGPPVP